jgi:hypothetical protein
MAPKSVQIAVVVRHLGTSLSRGFLGANID